MWFERLVRQNIKYFVQTMNNLYGKSTISATTFMIAPKVCKKHKNILIANFVLINWVILLMLEYLHLSNNSDNFVLKFEKILRIYLWEHV